MKKFHGRCYESISLKIMSGYYQVKLTFIFVWSILTCFSNFVFLTWCWICYIYESFEINHFHFVWVLTFDLKTYDKTWSISYVCLFPEYLLIQNNICFYWLFPDLDTIILFHFVCTKWYISGQLWTKIRVVGFVGFRWYAVKWFIIFRLTGFHWIQSNLMENLLQEFQVLKALKLVTSILFLLFYFPHSATAHHPAHHGYLLFQLSLLYISINVFIVAASLSLQLWDWKVFSYKLMILEL